MKTISLSVEYLLFLQITFALEHVKLEDLPTGEDTDMIQCGICSGWYHRTCVNLSHEQFKELSLCGCAIFADAQNLLMFLTRISSS